MEGEQLWLVYDALGVLINLSEGDRVGITRMIRIIIFKSNSVAN